MSQAPKPFSHDWYTNPEEPERPRRHAPRAVDLARAVGRRLPGERALGVLTVLCLVFASMWMSGPHGAARVEEGVNAIETPIPSGDFSNQGGTDSSDTSISTDTLQVAEGASGAPTADASRARTAPKLELQATQAPSTTDGLLAGHRVITFYGFPGNDKMGILGEYDKETALAKLREQAAAYEAADPSTPVLVGFEVIASVGQKDAQADGSYLLDASSELLDEYADFCEENGILLFLDVQIGRRSVETDTHGLEKWLAKPFVHLAIDPEFAMQPGQIPGDVIGSVDAADITATQNWLVQLSQHYAIPPKVLIVHQFHDGMIQNKETLAAVPGVELVIDADGWGPPDQKRSTYAFVNGAQAIEYDGIKLFYRQDDPIMTPEEIVKLSPTPQLVIYQ